MTKLSKKYGIKTPNWIVLIILALLTVAGVFIGLYMFVHHLTGGPTALGMLLDIVYLAAYFLLIYYAIWARNNKKMLKTVVYAYAVLLGIQILQSGNFITNYHMSESTVIWLNILNLIAFGNIIAFAGNFDNKKVSVGTVSVAVFAKLLAELILIFMFASSIDAMTAAMSMSVPVLGITIFAAYLVMKYKEGSK
jgi:hypothetical protein